MNSCYYECHNKWDIRQASPQHQKELINYIKYLTTIKDFKHLSFESSYRIFYNFAIHNKFDNINQWLSDLIDELSEQNNIIMDINIIADVLMYILNINQHRDKFEQKLQYKYNNKKIIINRETFIAICENINQNIIDKNVLLIYHLRKYLSDDLIKNKILNF